MGSASDVRAWSGLNTHILHALQAAGLQTVVVDDLESPQLYWPRLKARIGRRWLGKSFPLDRDRSIARRWSEEAARRLASHADVKCVVSPGTIPIAQLPVRYQTVIWADATFHSLRTTYSGFERLARASIESGDWIEQRAYDRSVMVCFSSEWAAADAASFYGVPAHKLAVIPYGANCPPAYADLNAAHSSVRARARTECRLVFIGMDWERKGGTLVLEAAHQLRYQGVPVHLSLVGGAPPPNVMLPPWIEKVGFLNKQMRSDWEKWDALLRNAHFLILPSIADCTPIVFSEAAAYAVPSLARDVGGVSSVVRDGANGFLFPVSEGAGAYVDLITKLWRDTVTYEKIAISSYLEWEQRLNWLVAGRQFVDRLQAISSAASSKSSLQIK